MPIVLQDTSGLAQGIQTAGSALASALESRAQNRLMQQQRSALDEALAGADLTTQEGQQDFMRSMVSAGVPVKDISGILGVIGKRGQVTDPVLRSNYNNNLKLSSGITHDAKQANALLKESKGVLDAIESGNVAGEGLSATGKRMFRWLSGTGTPSDEQTLDTIRKRTLINMGDFKGIRLTDTKLRMMQDSLFAPNKSQEANIEAYRLWVDDLLNYMEYAQILNQILEENPDAMYSPDLEMQIIRRSGGRGLGEEIIMQQPTKQFQNLPDPVKYSGKKIRNEETGEIYISDGSTWKRVE